VEDEDVDTQIRNGHAENNRSLKKKKQKCSEYEHVMLFVLHEYQTSYAKIVIRIGIFFFQCNPLAVSINNITIHEATESKIVTSVSSFYISFSTSHESI